MGRIALTDALLRNAGIQEGDYVNLYFDATTKAIIVERAIASDAAVSSEASRVNKKINTP